MTLALEHHETRSAALSRNAFYWTKAMWPPVLSVLAAAFLFRKPVQASIATSPHPELVYAIFFVAAAATVLFATAQRVYLREMNWLRKLTEAEPQARMALLEERDDDDGLSPVYQQVLRTAPLSLRERQSAVETEMESCDRELMGRLALPNFLVGALVGLGLVGTFIGLLQTLGQLASLFSSMAGGGGGGGDPSAMFSDLIGKLQGPMQGMGTAFVASLYGLLGSLVLGLTAAAVKRTGEELFSKLGAFLNAELYDGLERYAGQEFRYVAGEEGMPGAAQLTAGLEHLRRDAALGLAAAGGAVRSLGETITLERAGLLEAASKLDASVEGLRFEVAQASAGFAVALSNLGRSVDAHFAQGDADRRLLVQSMQSVEALAAQIQAERALTLSLTERLANLETLHQQGLVESQRTRSSLRRLRSMATRWMRIAGVTQREMRAETRRFRVSVAALRRRSTGVLGQAGWLVFVGGLALGCAFAAAVLLGAAPSLG